MHFYHGALRMLLAIGYLYYKKLLNNQSDFGEKIVIILNLEFDP